MDCLACLAKLRRRRLYYLPFSLSLTAVRLAMVSGKGLFIEGFPCPLLALTDGEVRLPLRTTTTPVRYMRPIFVIAIGCCSVLWSTPIDLLAPAFLNRETVSFTYLKIHQRLPEVKGVIVTE